MQYDKLTFDARFLTIAPALYVQVSSGLNHYFFSYRVHRHTHTQKHTHTETQTDMSTL